MQIALPNPSHVINTSVPKKTVSSPADPVESFRRSLAMEASDLLRRAEERRRAQLMKEKAMGGGGGAPSAGNQPLPRTESAPLPSAPAPKTQVLDRKSSALAALFPEKGSAWIHKETALLCKTDENDSKTTTTATAIAATTGNAPANPSSKAEKSPAAPTPMPRKMPVVASTMPRKMPVVASTIAPRPPPNTQPQQPLLMQQQQQQLARGVQNYNTQEAQLFSLGDNPSQRVDPPPPPLPLPQLLPTRPPAHFKIQADVDLDSSKKKNSRIRTAVACVSCRASKVRCDGGRPCKRCKKMGRDCVQPEPRKRRRGAGEQVNRTSRPQPLFDEHGVKRKALADKFNRHRAQRCYRNGWCTRPYKHPGHCKDYR